MNSGLFYPIYRDERKNLEKEVEFASSHIREDLHKLYQTISEGISGRICDDFIIKEPAMYIHITTTMFTGTKYLHIN